MSPIIDLCYSLPLLLLSHHTWVQSSSVEGLSYDTFQPRNLNIKPVNATHHEVTFRLEEDHRNVYWVRVQTVPENIAASDPRILGKPAKLPSNAEEFYRILAKVDKTNRQPLYLVYQTVSGFFKTALIMPGNQHDNELSKAGEQKNYGDGISEHRWTFILSGAGLLALSSVISVAVVARRWSCYREQDMEEEQHTFEVFNVPNTSTSTSRNYQPRMEQQQTLEVWNGPNNSSSSSSISDYPHDTRNKTTVTTNDDLSTKDMVGQNNQGTETADILLLGDITKTMFSQTAFKKPPKVMVKTTTNKQKPEAFRKPRCPTPDSDQEDQEKEVKEYVYENLAMDRTSIIYENIITRVINRISIRK